jgi:hypothetical protein
MSKKTKIKEWKIENYNLRLYKQAGSFGPITYKYYLDKDKTIPALFYRKKSKIVPFNELYECIVTFLLEENDSLSFNLCEQKNSIELPGPKERLDSSLISKIEVVKIDSSNVRRIVLNTAQKALLVGEWNKKSNYLLGSPKIMFLIIVTPIYGAVRTFNSDGSYIYEQGNNARYEFRNHDFFPALFN